MHSRVMVVILGLVATGCATSAQSTGEPPSVVASITIVADFTQQVAGDRVAVHSLVEHGEDPHTYEPTPGTARLLASADLVLRNGLGLAPWLDPLLRVGEHDIVTVTDGLRPLVDTDGPFAGDPDPHLWMDPALAAGYVTAIRDALVERFPAHATVFAERADAYLGELAELDAWIATQLNTIPVDRRKLVTTHDAFRYFGQRYGLEVVGTIWSISTEREPSADEIRRLVDDIRAQDVPAVFAETTINPRLMQRVAADAGVRMGRDLYGDSVGAPGTDAETYLGMMRANTLAIVEGLSAPPASQESPA